MIEPAGVFGYDLQRYAARVFGRHHHAETLHVRPPDTCEAVDHEGYAIFRPGDAEKAGFSAYKR